MVVCVNACLRTSRGCGVCDMPELWCGAAGLCARVRACAGAAESLHTYIHTLYKKLRNGVGARNSAGWLSQIGCVLCLCCPGYIYIYDQLIAQDIPTLTHTRTHANSTHRTHILTHQRHERHSHSRRLTSHTQPHSPATRTPLAFQAPSHRPAMAPPVPETAPNSCQPCTHHIRTRTGHKCVKYAPRRRCQGHRSNRPLHVHKIGVHSGAEGRGQRNRQGRGPSPRASSPPAPGPKRRCEASAPGLGVVLGRGGGVGRAAVTFLRRSRQPARTLQPGLTRGSSADSRGGADSPRPPGGLARGAKAECRLARRRRLAAATRWTGARRDGLTRNQP